MATAIKMASPRVGDQVVFSWGGYPVRGRIVEDRGPLAPGGRQVYRIEAVLEPDDHMILEMTPDQFEIQG